MVEYEKENIFPGILRAFHHIADTYTPTVKLQISIELEFVFYTKLRLKVYEDVLTLICCQDHILTEKYMVCMVLLKHDIVVILPMQDRLSLWMLEG